MAGRLSDVAKQAGVSEATVSRVLNGKPGISDATRAAVLTALDVSATNGRRSCVPTRPHGRAGVPELQNPIFPALAEVVAGALAQRGFNAVLCTRTGSMSEAEYVEMLLERQVSGMVFAGGQYAEADAPHDHYTRLLRAASAGRARERRRRAPRLPPGLDRRRGRDGPGVRASRKPRPRQDRVDSRAAGPRPVPAQAGGIRAPPRRNRTEPRRVRRANEILARGWACGGDAAHRAWRDRHRVCQRSVGTRRDPCCAPRRALGPCRRLGHRLRRLGRS